MAMKDLLEYLAGELLGSSEGVEVKVRSGRHSVTLDLYLPAEEAGKVIGRNGRVIRAVRDVLGVVAARENKRVHLEVHS
ncbi:MAG: UPF0109 protein [Herpetosiphonaceae bacterium]|nr:MAG: UPF0109 protein [Herpetosiphonaceae bacterium]